MNIEDIRQYCLSKEGATEDAAFGVDTVLFRLCNKIFAFLDLTRPDHVVVNSSEERAVELRAHYRGICGAWHWNKKYWSEVALDEDVDEALVYQLIDESYDRIRCQLPKKTLYHFPDLPEGWEHHHFGVVDSTVNLLRKARYRESPSPCLLLTADYQTAGKGQGTNVWESEAQKNLLFSFRFFPKQVKAVDQFVLLQVLSLAVCATLKSYCGKSVTIKWPNDIYCEDHKMCGILIEHDICGGNVAETRCGIGINVNQMDFHSDAPNPQSIGQYLGKEVDRAAVLRRFLKNFEHYLQRMDHREAEKLSAEYEALLYRRTGSYAYRDEEGVFRATFHHVDSSGRLVLQKEDGRLCAYAHKEVAFILNAESSEGKGAEE